MYLHLGNDIIVHQNSIIGVFDMDTSTISKHTRAFLKNMQDNAIVVNISEDLPKSFVLCTEKDKNILYISPISSRTLLKRSKQKNIVFT